MLCRVHQQVLDVCVHPDKDMLYCSTGAALEHLSLLPITMLLSWTAMLPHPTLTYQVQMLVVLPLAAAFMSSTETQQSSCAAGLHHS